MKAIVRCLASHVTHASRADVLTEQGAKGNYRVTFVGSTASGAHPSRSFAMSEMADKLTRLALTVAKESDTLREAGK